MNSYPLPTYLPAPAERGASLIMVMLILVVVSLLGVGGAQIALMSERGARNDRDLQVAWQAAEAALLDAELDMTNFRDAIFDGKSVGKFVSGCGTSGDSVGLCIADTAKPAWLSVDFTNVSSSAPTVTFGAVTGRSFAAGGVGIQPAQKPRYMIELVRDPAAPPGKMIYIYRVTAMGFGPRVDIQAVLQMIYRT